MIFPLPRPLLFDFFPFALAYVCMSVKILILLNLYSSKQYYSHFAYFNSSIDIKQKFIGKKITGGLYKFSPK